MFRVETLQDEIANGEIGWCDRVVLRPGEGMSCRLFGEGDGQFRNEGMDEVVVVDQELD